MPLPTVPADNAPATMICTIPYLPTVEWYAAWLNACLEGCNPEEAVSRANRYTGIKGKDWLRAPFPTPDGTGRLLSVPAEGGSSAAKRIPPGELVVSGHGNWPGNHLGAFEAICGRMPFYRHIEPEVARIIHSAPGKKLSEVTEGLHNVALRLLGLPKLLPSLQQAFRTAPGRLKQIGADLTATYPDGIHFTVPPKDPKDPKDPKVPKVPKVPKDPKDSKILKEATMLELLAAFGPDAIFLICSV